MIVTALTIAGSNSQQIFKLGKPQTVKLNEKISRLSRSFSLSTSRTVRRNSDSKGIKGALGRLGRKKRI